MLAAGSLGAIVGAVLAGFVALPLIGSVATFAGCGLLALLCVPFITGKAPGAGDKGDVSPTAAKPPVNVVSIV